MRSNFDQENAKSVLQYMQKWDADLRNRRNKKI